VLNMPSQLTGWTRFRRTLRLRCALPFTTKSRGRWLRAQLDKSCGPIAVLYPSSTHEVVAFAAAVFVSERFAHREISNPKPGLNARIISSIEAGWPVVLTETDLRYGNTYGGLCQVILYSTWRRGILTPQQTEEVEIEFAKSYVQLYAGYQLKLLLFEATDATDIEHAKSAKVWVSSAISQIFMPRTLAILGIGIALLL
jgi:hypothetical protein